MPRLLSFSQSYRASRTLLKKLIYAKLGITYIVKDEHLQQV